MAFEQPVPTIGVKLEKESALADARNIMIEIGALVKIRPYFESNISRGRLNNIKNKNESQVTELLFYCFPVIFSPTDKQLEDFGIREKTEVLIKTAMLDWNNYGYTLETLNEIDSIRAVAIINGAKYEIKTKQFDSQYQDTYLYVHIGLNKV